MSIGHWPHFKRSSSFSLILPLSLSPDPLSLSPFLSPFLSLPPLLKGHWALSFSSPLSSQEVIDLSSSPSLSPPLSRRRLYLTSLRMFKFKVRSMTPCQRVIYSISLIFPFSFSLSFPSHLSPSFFSRGQWLHVQRSLTSLLRYRFNFEHSQTREIQTPS